MINREGKLWIFESFEVDTNLPKYKTAESESLENSSMPHTNSFVLPTNNLVQFSSGSMDAAEQEERWLVEQANKIEIQADKDTLGRFFYRKIWGWLMNNSGGHHSIQNKTSEADNVVKKTVFEFFHSIKNSAAELQIISNRAESYKKTIDYAQSCGQQALVEQLTGSLEVVRAETQLLAMGTVRVVTEEQVVSFYKECEKGLRLDWVKNFSRLIPAEVVEAKLRADERHVFDNYVVLHYDPKGKSYAQTEKEKEAEKRKKEDPILFGVIKGSRKLYFIGDWIDEECDLTMEQFVDKFGEKAIEANNLKVNKYL